MGKNKQNIKIKGKVFIDNISLAKAPVGIKAYFGTEAIAIYKKKLYLNTLSNFSSIRNDAFIVPFTRISEEEDGFAINFENVSLSTPPRSVEPKREHGWIGPFNIETEEFSWEAFYGEASLVNIVDICNDALEYPNSVFEKMIRKVYRKIFSENYQKTGLADINSIILEINNQINKVKEANSDTELDDEEREANTIIIAEYKRNKECLKDIFNEKIQINRFHKLEDADLNFLMERINKDSDPLDFTLAGAAKRELDLRRSELVSKEEG